MTSTSSQTSLPPDSYTARRLAHSTEPHLHYTSRRAFVGPIPEGWLKSHRKQWYRKYLTVGSIKRAPTFTAAEPAPSLDSQGLAAAAPAVEPIQNGEDQRTLSVQSPVLSAGDGSTTSLLREQRAAAASASQVGTQSDTRTQSTSVPATTEAPAKSRSSRVATKLGVPKVHFNEPTKLQLRARAQRLAAKGSLRSNKIKDGEILKMDRMLVRIDVTQQTLPKDFDEKTSLGIETKSLDRWREFVVVCRKYRDGDATAVLQLYQTRVIATSVSDPNKAKKKPKAQITLSISQAGVNLYSSLDKTLCVWTAGNSRTTIYYLKPQSGAASVEWFTLLRGAFGWPRSENLQVNVPDLSVSLRLGDPFNSSQISHILAEAAEGNDDALAKAVSDEQGAAGAIVARCIEMLQKSPEWADVLKAWAQYDRIGLAWKRYDRLEWIHGAVEQRMYGTIAMAKTHELELRPKDHYPVSTKTAKGKTLREPFPVEGFLIRLTSQKGQERSMGKMLFKRLYFTTQNQYLLFLRPARAVPPRPPKMRGAATTGSVPSAKQLVAGDPLTYDIDPYPLENDRISWLDHDDIRNAADQKARDSEAAAEAERNNRMLLDCDGFINLCDVKHIRRMHKGAAAADTNLEEGSDVEFDFEQGQAEESAVQDDGDATELVEDRIFELVMKNGLIVRLQAYNKTARQEWMKRLRALAKYWRHRVRADVNLLKSVRQQNLDTLGIDERAEATVGSFAYKWEVGQSYASPEMYNMCGISQCRTIHLSGLLFRKPRRHTTFSRCHVILAHGHLLIFQDTLRSRTGRKLVHVHQERIAAISLAGCYLYSGMLTENDLLYQNTTFDSNAPGNHALPRMFLEDGWTSTDEDAMTTFVIWHAKSKSWFKSSHTVDDVRFEESAAERDQRKERKTRLTRVSQLGTTGRSVLFKARSRAERDHWVMSIQNEIERLAAEERTRGDDVRLEQTS